VTVTAANGVGAPAHQALTVAVDQAPSITTASSDSVTAGQPFTYTVSADGFPAASLSSSGPKVAGVKFTNDKNGTGTYSGTPTAPGNYTFTVTAKNAAGTGTQTFTLQVTG
jgi:PKD repeat protein